MRIDKIKKYILPNIPYLFILWCCLKLGTAYRLAAGTGFGERLIGTVTTIGPAFETITPALSASIGLSALLGPLLSDWWCTIR